MRKCGRGKGEKKGHAQGDKDKGHHAMEKSPGGAATYGCGKGEAPGRGARRAGLTLGIKGKGAADGARSFRAPPQRRPRLRQRWQALCVSRRG
jgi:hypothetical protein